MGGGNVSQPAVYLHNCCHHRHCHRCHHVIIITTALVHIQPPQRCDPNRYGYVLAASKLNIRHEIWSLQTVFLVPSPPDC